MIEKYIKNTIKNIIEEIKKEEYDIDNKQILELLNKIEKLDIVIGKNKVVLHTYEGNEIEEIDLDSQYGSYVLEYPPIKDNKSLILVKPIMRLFPFKNINVFNSTFYHELCHVLSIGKWRIINFNTIEHISGISKQEFIYNGKVATEVKINDNIDIVQEQLNDWVSQKLYTLIEKKQYSSNNTLQTKNCSRYIDEMVDKKLNGDYRKMIGYYFTNNLEKIQNVLISEKYADLNKLNSYFNDLGQRQI